MLQLDLGSGNTEFVEVIRGWNEADGSCSLLWKGQLLQLAAGEQPGSTLKLAAFGKLLIPTCHDDHGLLFDSKQVRPACIMLQQQHSQINV